MTLIEAAAIGALMRQRGLARAKPPAPERKRMGRPPREGDFVISESRPWLNGLTRRQYCTAVNREQRERARQAGRPIPY